MKPDLVMSSSSKEGTSPDSPTNGKLYDKHPSQKYFLSLSLHCKKEINNKTHFVYLFESKPCLHPWRQVPDAKQWADPQVQDHFQPWITANV